MDVGGLPSDGEATSGNFSAEKLPYPESACFASFIVRYCNQETNKNLLRRAKMREIPTLDFIGMYQGTDEENEKSVLYKVYLEIYSDTVEIYIPMDDGPMSPDYQERLGVAYAEATRELVLREFCQGEAKHFIPTLALLKEIILY